MPAQIPTYDMPTVTPGISPSANISNAGISSESASLPGRQLEQFGQAVQGAAATTADIKVDELDQANQVRVDDAINQVRQKAMDLTYDPQAGYQNLKGLQALQRPGNLPLDQEYAGKLQEASGTIANNLGNDAQKRLYNLRANDVVTGFKGDVETHMLGEYRNYHGSVADGNLKLSLQDAQTSWSDPTKVDTAINGMIDPVTGKRFGGVKQSIYAKGQLDGTSADELQANMNTAVSGVHASVVESAIQNNSLDYANSYMNANKGQMLAPDLLKSQGMLNTKNDAHMAIQAATQSTAKYQSSFAPNDMDRLTGIVMGKESGGQRYGGAGSVAGPNDLTTSPKGAQGEMQVMPTTQTDPGFGVTPAKDNSPDEIARVGKDYLAAMVQRYGDPATAMAAYNAGPGAVDAAKADAVAFNKTPANAGQPTKSYMDFLPGETQDYVATNMKRYNAGLGAPQLPSKIEFVNDAITRLGTNPRTEALDATREQATKQYEMLIQQRKDMGDQALQSAQQELIANGGNFTQLAPAVVSNLSRFDPGKYDDAQKFAKAIGDDNLSTNMPAYMQAMQHPQELAAMPDATFQQFVMTNFDKSDRDKIINLRQQYASGTSTDAATSLNTEAINSVMKTRLGSLGLDPEPSAKTDATDFQRVSQIYKFVNDDIYAQQQQLGRKMNPKELGDRIDQLFSMNAQNSNFFGADKTALPVVQVGDLPSALVKSIRDKLTNRYGTPASDALVLDYYKKAFVKKATTLKRSPTNEELTSR